MPSISIGIHAHAEPDRLWKTLDAVRATAGDAYELLVLADGPDPETADALRHWTDIEVSGTEEPKGTAACFNRLVAARSADFHLLLESGVIPTEGWLERLLEAFKRYPKCGLAGPSTNRAWNEQCIFPTALDTTEEIARLSAIAERRYGATCRTLEPLYSLSDFCYMVRRETVEAVGKADEEYGLGPCWEMDYNVRATRAGFQGLWACGSYVHRAPFTARRWREESRRFEASKHRYQDKYCGLRLRGIKRDYRQHCRGDACPNFAPTLLFGLDAPAPLPLARSESPLVSCIMPTYNRRRFIPDALRCFAHQDYPNLELIILDDGTDPIADLIPEDPRIRYWRLQGKVTVGEKRNQACELAAGEFIIHWDDDDWYSPSRVRRQIEPLLAKRGAVTGTSTLFYYDRDRNQAFRYEYHGPVCAWLGGLAYSKSLWERQRFEPIQVSEDVRFLAHVPPALRFDIRDPALMIAAIHSENVSAKVTTGDFWKPEPVERVRPLIGLAHPLVSCIMPTYNRRPFMSLTLECFQRQTYPNRELIVVDDGTDPVADILEGQPNVRYIRLTRRHNIGAKRNLACEAAQGDIVAHWDDDDWYAPDRLACQAEPLRADTHDLTGLANRYMLEMPAGRFWSTSDAVHSRMFVGNLHGGTLVYRRALWQDGIRYPEVNLAEDAGFIRHASQAGKRIVRLENPGVFVYLRHTRNTWQFEPGSFVDPAGWIAACAPPGFSAELMDAYRSACEKTGGAT
ncbi:MAG TPA: glycosyltransferase [Bryobacteraceae bacterium]|nr:glycosyltransferase [Bryobacteraceae bacterium]